MCGRLQAITRTAAATIAAERNLQKKNKSLLKSRVFGGGRETEERGFVTGTRRQQEEIITTEEAFFTPDFHPAAGLTTRSSFCDSEILLLTDSV